MEQQYTGNPPFTAARRSAAAPGTVMLGDLRSIVARSAAIMGLVGVALIHLLDAPGKYSETRYMFWMYIGLILSSLALAAVHVHRDSRRAWAATGILAAATALGFCVSRSTGLPSAMGDIGNWTEPLGLASLLIEGCLIALSIYRLAVIQWKPSVPVASFTPRAGQRMRTSSGA